MTEFDGQIGFSVTRSPFHFNLSMRWFKKLMLLSDDLMARLIQDLLWQQQAAMKKGNELSRYIKII